jgi:hypothetical protein
MATPPTTLGNTATWDAQRRRRNALLRAWARGPRHGRGNSSGSAIGNAGGGGQGAAVRGETSSVGRHVTRSILPMDRLADAGRFHRMQQVRTWGLQQVRAWGP